MIHRFRPVIPGVLYRGSAPTPKDVLELKEKLGIKKIVSLDQESGEKISRGDDRRCPRGASGGCADRAQLREVRKDARPRGVQHPRRHLSDRGQPPHHR